MKQVHGLLLLEPSAQVRTWVLAVRFTVSTLLGAVARWVQGCRLWLRINGGRMAEGECSGRLLSHQQF